MAGRVSGAVERKDTGGVRGARPRRSPPVLAVALAAVLAAAPVSDSLAVVLPDTTLAVASRPSPRPALPRLGASAAVADALRARAARAAQDDPRRSVSVHLRVAPSALYSSTRGIGIGGGVGVRNLVGPGSLATLDLRLQQRAQSVVAGFYTGDPFDAPVYGFVGAEASTTQRRRYFGVGPFAEDTDEFYLNHNAATAEVRVGSYPLGHTGLLVQPGARLLYDRFLGIDDESPVRSLDALDAASAAALGAEDEARYGVSLGLDLGSDLRDWRPYPRSGTFGTVEGRRFFALDGSGLRFNRYAVSTIGYLPIRGRTTIIGRFNLVLTRSGDSDGDGAADPIPFYYLPTLDDRLAAPFQGDRLVGRDVAVGALGVRVPIWDFIGAYGFDALVMGFLGNVYDNVFDQFSPSVDFSGDVQPSSGRAALRPALGLGIGLVNLDRERVVLGGLIGIGPGGLKLATLRVAYDLRDARPLFR